MVQGVVFGRRTGRGARVGMWPGIKACRVDLGSASHAQHRRQSKDPVQQ